MPLDEGLMFKLRQTKRKRSPEPESEPEPSRSFPPTTGKRQKSNETPSSFWDNLSRQWLTSRALREFDRRTTSRKILSQPRCLEFIAKGNSQLKRFARHGGPDLEDLRSFPEPHLTSKPAPMSSKQSSSRQSKSEGTRASPNTSITKSSGRRTSAYDPAFKQHLEDHGIILSNWAEKPANWEEVLDELQNPRPSLSPSRFTVADFEAFQARNDEATSETGVMSKVFPVIIGDRDIPSQQNIEFNNLAALTDGSIVNAKPDFYDGSRPSKENRQLREELDSFIVPTTNTSRPCLPNFFVEGKGPDGSSAVAKLQACYDGALGARGMHEVRSYANPEDPFDNNAYTITSTYAGGAGSDTLKLYAVHPASSGSTENPMEYRMTQVGSYAMTHNQDAFLQGATALRNARDWAGKKREEVVREATMRLHMHTSEESAAEASQTTTLTQEGSDTSIDELSQEAPMLTSFTSTASFDSPSADEPHSSSKKPRLEQEPRRVRKKPKKGPK